jgi:hypothetical protein
MTFENMRFANDTIIILPWADDDIGETFMNKANVFAYRVRIKEVLHQRCERVVPVLCCWQQLVIQLAMIDEETGDTPVSSIITQ